MEALGRQNETIFWGKISATAGAKIGNGFPFVLKQIRCGSPFWSLSKRSKLLQKVETKWVEIDTFQLKDADLALFGRPLGNGAFFTGGVGGGWGVG